MFNKMDLLEEHLNYPLVGGDSVYISAKTGQNFEELISIIEEKIFANR